MKISLIKLEQFSGRSTNFYTVAVDDDDKSLFQYFIESNLEQHGTEIRNLLMRIKAMGMSPEHGSISSNSGKAKRMTQ